VTAIIIELRTRRPVVMAPPVRQKPRNIIPASPERKLTIMLEEAIAAELAAAFGEEAVVPPLVSL
jgi:hypothetical protein